MRDNFERFGSMASIDSVKREINTYNWPYVAISMYNEMEQLCLGCEGIVCTERVEAYKALIKFCTDNSPKRSREDINVIFSDRFVRQEIVTKSFELPNAHFVLDQWHLLDSILKKRLGRLYLDKNFGYIRFMINASSLEIFNKAYEDAFSILVNLPNRNANTENELTRFRDGKDHYASFIIAKKRLKRGNHSSTISEINHSRVICWLNDGDRQGNKYTEDPHTLVKDLSRRQEVRIKKYNQFLYNEWLELKSEMKSFNDSTSPCLKEAINHICLRSYLRFKRRVQRLHEYSVQAIPAMHRIV